MSALNIFVTADAVHAFTDGGLYDPHSMKLQAIAPKIALLPQYSAILGSTGHSFIPELLQASINRSEFASFDDMVAGFPTFVSESVEFWSKQPGGLKDWGRFTIALAGWSEKENGPIAYVMRGWSNLDMQGFKMHEVLRSCSPHDSVIESLPFDGGHAAQSGLDIMRVQRSRKFGSYTAATTDTARNMLARTEDRTDGFQIVHGFCQYTRVDCDGIHTKIIERWS